MGAESSLSFLNRLRHKVQAVTYGSPIYRMMLEQGSVPDALVLTFPDPWPGDADAGQALISQRETLFAFEGGWSAGSAFDLASHVWLRDLRAVGTDTARRRARGLLEGWMQQQETWHEGVWEPSVLGARLASWVAFYTFFGDKAPPEFVSEFIKSMCRQLRHLTRVMPPMPVGAEGLAAVKGLVYASLALGDTTGATGLGLELLSRQLVAEILPDGGHVTRNPTQHMAFLRHLIDLRAALRVAGIAAPAELPLAIQRMVPALKLFRHNDGGFALFNGAREAKAFDVDATLTLAEVKGRVLRHLADTGFERVTASRSLLLVDVGAPPPRPYDATAHAGLLSFEFSVGKERLIVNCGQGPDDDPAWRVATAATAAHSTLTFDDMNACEILEAGGIGARPTKVEAQRYEQDGAHFIEAAHDGYAAREGVMVHRALRLSSDGETLSGRDVVAGPPGRRFAVRWHLHPSVQALLVSGGQAAFLRTPSGSGWRLRIEAGDIPVDLALESSIYCGGETPRRTLQLKASARSGTGPAAISWVLSREKGKMGRGKAKTKT